MQESRKKMRKLKKENNKDVSMEVMLQGKIHFLGIWLSSSMATYTAEMCFTQGHVPSWAAHIQ